MRTIALLALLALAICASAADITIFWQCPSTNTDGTALSDVTGYEVDAVKLQVVASIVSNRVRGFVFLPGPTTTLAFAASTNAPTVGQVESNRTTLAAGWYIFTGRTVCGERESADCPPVTNRVGTPSTIGVVSVR